MFLKKRDEVTLEEMRYRVPGVRNRFFNVHGKIIAICAVICFVFVSFALALVSVKQNNESRATMSAYFFVNLSSPEETISRSTMYSVIVKCYYVLYDDTFASETGSGFDFSSVNAPSREILEESILRKEGNFLVMINSGEKNHKCYTSDDMPLLGKENLSSDDIFEILKDIYGI